MNVISVNRSVLAALIGSVLAFGLSASPSVRARAIQDASGSTQDATGATTAQDEDAANQRRRVRAEREAAARAADQRTAPPARPEPVREPQEVQRDQRQQQEQRRQVYEQQDQRQQQESQRAALQERQQAAVQQQQRAAQYQRQRGGQDGRTDGNAVSDEQNRAGLIELERRQAEARDQQQRQREADVRNSGDTRAPRTDTSGAPPAYDRNNDRRNDRNYDRDSGSTYQGQQRPDNGRRLSDRQQQQLIEQQRQQAAQYSRQLQSRDGYARQHAQDLQRQRRNSQYRYQQSYWERQRREMQRNNWQTYNYNNDPYFYTAPSYRYYRGGSYYNINQYGADLLRQAINYGYAEGIRAGEADRYDGWRYSYRDSYVYQDANYGYRGMYVSQSEYNYYFRQGFQRGYEDGYYGRRRYGRSYNGSDALLGTVLSLVLNLQSYRY